MWQAVGFFFTFNILLHITCNWSNQGGSDGLGACSVHRGDEKLIQNLDWKARREETTWKT
jgi:hypothetical protein